ncbi:hypothetical protein C7T94_17385 [Pedobacter yulinensis]|uniref:Ligand-binding SRPBCC domain-containing protein n=1 Tax=Pedobacter yulinensis TaxID=2126353 RepID=A0A2T3HHV9_9SPHI|nr:hypothetical protein C7T94_17385 [Pedobacter yulinensis]
METVWNFFSSPVNLAKITPAEMQFIITSDFNEHTKMFPGMLITYKVAPVLNIKMNWVTEITHMQEKSYFIDEQRIGPFAFWHHLHQFEENKDGVLMKDTLYYDVGMSIAGAFADAVMVNRRVKNIFAYRSRKISELFIKK